MTTATIASAATPFATNTATTAVAVARTNATDAEISWLTAIPDRPAPSVTTWTMSLRRMPSTNDQRADRIAVERLVAKLVDDLLLEANRVDRRGARHRRLDADDHDEHEQQRPERERAHIDASDHRNLNRIRRIGDGVHDRHQQHEADTAQ